MAGGEVAPGRSDHPAPIHLWRVSAAAPPRPGELESLSEHERLRAARLHRPADRAAYLGAHIALRRVLAAWTGREPAELEFDRTCEHCGDREHGRPALAGRAGPWFSLSRAGAVALIAVVDGPAVGVDVEAVDPPETWMAVRDEFFTAGEREAFEPAQAARWWARKEAVAKALGLGMALPFHETDVRGAEPWLEVPAGGATVVVRDLPVPAPGYVAAVALREPPPRVVVLES